MVAGRRGHLGPAVENPAADGNVQSAYRVHNGLADSPTAHGAVTRVALQRRARHLAQEERLHREDWRCWVARQARPLLSELGTALPFGQSSCVAGLFTAGSARQGSSGSITTLPNNAMKLTRGGLEKERAW